MKVLKSYSIDLEVAQQLVIKNIKNVSGLINDLLKNYLQIYTDDLTKMENDIEKEILKAEAFLNSLKNSKQTIEDEKQRKEEETKKEIKEGKLIIID
jgi:hypothetical protein